METLAVRPSRQRGEGLRCQCGQPRWLHLLGDVPRHSFSFDLSPAPLAALQNVGRANYEAVLPVGQAAWEAADAVLRTGTAVRTPEREANEQCAGPPESRDYGPDARDPTQSE